MSRHYCDPSNNFNYHRPQPRLSNRWCLSCGQFVCLCGSLLLSLFVNSRIQKLMPDGGLHSTSAVPLLLNKIVLMFSITNGGQLLPILHTKTGQNRCTPVFWTCSKQATSDGNFPKFSSHGYLWLVSSRWWLVVSCYAKVAVCIPVLIIAS